MKWGEGVIFFDLDDTLMDFKTSEHLAVSAFYTKYQSYFNFGIQEFYTEWCSVGQRHFQRFLNGELSFDQQKQERMKELFFKVEIRLSEEAASSYFKDFLQHFEDSWMLFDDVVPCLERLGDYELGILTNGDSCQQRLKLKKLGILPYFNTIVTASEVGVAKPNPLIFLQTCKRANRAPEECTYVGDDLYTDILACRAVQMIGVWLNRNAKSSELESDYIRSLLDLKEVL